MNDQPYAIGSEQFSVRIQEDFEAEPYLWILTVLFVCLLHRCSQRRFLGEYRDIPHTSESGQRSRSRSPAGHQYATG